MYAFIIYLRVFVGNYQKVCIITKIKYANIKAKVFMLTAL